MKINLKTTITEIEAQLFHLRTIVDEFNSKITNLESLVKHLKEVLHKQKVEKEDQSNY